MELESTRPPALEEASIELSADDEIEACELCSSVGEDAAEYEGSGELTEESIEDSSGPSLLGVEVVLMSNSDDVVTPTSELLVD